MTRDIAEYFIERCKRLRQANDIEGALQRLYWAKRLWRQYDKMDQNISTDEPRPVKESQKMKEINKLIEEIESELPKSGSDEDAANSDDDCVQSSEPTG
ncbi:unnamed protein product [Adineta steineri]|nr:unnamed protein product [Adineta steineri]